MKEKNRIVYLCGAVYCFKKKELMSGMERMEFE